MLNWLRTKQFEYDMIKAITMVMWDNDRYQEFIVKSFIETVFMEYLLKGKLIGLSVCDLPGDGMSAVYIFSIPIFQNAVWEHLQS